MPINGPPIDKPVGRAARLKAAARHVLATQLVMNLAILALTLVVLALSAAVGIWAGAIATYLLGIPMVFGLMFLMVFVNARYRLYRDESWGIELALGGVVFVTLLYTQGLLGSLVYSYRAAEIELSQPEELAQHPPQSAFYRIRESTTLEALRGKHTSRAKRSSHTWEVRPLVRPGADPQQTLDQYQAGRQCTWMAYKYDAGGFATPALWFSDESPYFVEVYDREDYRWAAAAALKLAEAPECSRFYSRTPAPEDMIAELWRRAGWLFLLVNLAPWVFFLWVLGHALGGQKA